MAAINNWLNKKNKNGIHNPSIIGSTSEYPFEPKQFTCGDHTMSYLDEGKGAPIVMLHGNPTWSFFYRNLVTSLKSKYRIIVPDHIGCGLSDKPQNYSYTLKNHINNLQALLSHLDLGSFSLVVHDWGGAIGMGYAVQHPENIRSIVILNTAAFRSSQIPFRIRLCRIPLVGELLVKGLNGFAWPATWMAVSNKLSKSTSTGFLAPYNSWQNRIAIHQFVKDIPLSPHDPSWNILCDIENKLHNLTDIPKIILWGGMDFCFDSHFFKRWKEIFPDAPSIYFKEAGHYLLEDAYEQVEPHMKDFFDQVHAYV